MIGQFIDVILHLDVHLAAWSSALGPWMYVILFLIIFAETGLVVTPFLPGDSLLFAVGALCSLAESGLSLALMIPLLILAALCGDLVNYSVGKVLGPRVFKSSDSILFNKKHLLKTEVFYQKHGPFTIVMARFVPIIRTFAPFVAGIGRMRFSKFIGFSITGAVTWVSLFLSGGYWFGNMPAVKGNFHVVIFGIIIVSVMPMVIEFVRSRRISH